MNTPCSTSLTLNTDHFDTEPFDQKCLEAYIRGDCMTKQDEKLAIQTLKSISASELFKTVENSLNTICKFSSTCNCETCYNYNSINLDCDYRINKTKYPSKNTEVIPQIQSLVQIENEKYLKYVDSLKISVGSLNINQSGWDNIYKSLGNHKPSYLINYFLQYKIPNFLTSADKQSKIDSGIEQNNVKICARKFNDYIFFNHTVIHKLKKLSQADIHNYDIEFKVSYRSHGQQFNFFGCATFNFGELLNQANFECSKNLNLNVDKNIPITIGCLKVLFQLGCGKLYFGSEFIGM